MRQTKNKKKLNKIGLVICIFMLTFIIQQSFSKYVIEIKDTNIQESIPFYFESGIANAGTAKQSVIDDWDGMNPKEITFDIKNYINNLLVTEQAIKYKIVATVVDEDTELEVKDSTLLSLSLEDLDNNVTIENNQELEIDGKELHENNYLLTITPNDTIENGKNFKIRVTITSTSPYEKELIGEISITVNRLEDYEISLVEAENNEYVTLNIKVNNPSRDIIIQYDNTKVILDKSGYIVNGLSVVINETINSFTIPKESLEQSKIYEINFGKQEESVVFGTDIICE